MMKFLRSQSQTVLIIVLGVIGLGFLFYGNAGNLLSPGGHVSNDYGRIDGQDLSVSDLYTAVRNTRYALILGGHAKQMTNAVIAQEAWRQLLLLREADRLHIEVTDDEVLEYIHKQELFQKDGVYSPEVFQNVMVQMQGRLRIPADASSDPLNSTKNAFITFVQNSLRTNAVSSALFSTVRTSNKDIGSQYEKFYGPATVSVVTFDAKSFENQAQVSPEEVAADYKANPLKAEYRTKEKRNIDYVIYSLTPEQAKLAPKEKKEAIDALGQKALEFALALQPEPTAGAAAPAPVDFIVEAKKHGLTPVTTGFFDQYTPPTGLPPSPSFNNAAFDLTKDDSISKVVTMDNGVAVLHLAEIQPSDLLPLDAVKASITETLKVQKAGEAEQAAAQKAATDLKAAMAKGTDFKAAAAALNLKVETLPSFVPMKAPPADPRLQVIAYVVTTLTDGQVSDPVPVQGGSDLLVIHLDSRAKADPAGLADFVSRFGAEQNQQIRNAVYLDWANWATKRPGTHKPPELDSYGGVE